MSKAYYCAEHKEKQKYFEHNLSLCYFVHHKSHMDHPGMEINWQADKICSDLGWQSL